MSDGSEASPQPGSAPSVWTGAWPAALAETAGLEMVTFDQGLENFPMSHLRMLELSP